VTRTHDGVDAAIEAVETVDPDPPFTFTVDLEPDGSRRALIQIPSSTTDSDLCLIAAALLNSARSALHARREKLVVNRPALWIPK